MTEQILELLSRTPTRLAEAAAGMSADLLRAPPQPDEWSANEVLAHLRSCADVWGDCIRTILDEDAPTIRAVNPRTWIEQTDYLDLDFATSLHSFVAQRHALLTVLEPLDTSEWERTATVTGAGKPLVRSVLSYAKWLATHERPHVKQIERVIGEVASSLRGHG